MNTSTSVPADSNAKLPVAVISLATAIFIISLVTSHRRGRRTNAVSHTSSADRQDQENMSRAAISPPPTLTGHSDKKASNPPPHLNISTVPADVDLPTADVFIPATEPSHASNFIATLSPASPASPSPAISPASQRSYRTTVASRVGASQDCFIPATEPVDAEWFAGMAGVSLTAEEEEQAKVEAWNARAPAKWGNARLRDVESPQRERGRDGSSSSGSGSGELHVRWRGQE